MADVPQQDDRTNDANPAPVEQPPVKASNEAYEAMDAQRNVTPTNDQSVLPGSPAVKDADPKAPSELQLTFENLFGQGSSEKFNKFLAGLNLKGGEAGKEGDKKGPQFVSPESCHACTLPKEQTGMINNTIAADIRAAKKPEETLRLLPNGQLERTQLSRNEDGSSLTVKTKEEYVRNEKGEIQKDKDGKALTRVLTEDKEAVDKEGKTTFKSHKDNQYNGKGDLTESNTDIYRVDKNGELSKLNSFQIKNQFNDKGQLAETHSAVLDANGKPVQSADAKYGYDEHGNRTSEHIERKFGNNRQSIEDREHTYKQFGDKFELMSTKANLYDRAGKPNGHMETTYDRDEAGKKVGEHTREYDNQLRVKHQFDASFDAKTGERINSTDIHKTFHANGAERTVTESKYNREGDSSAIRTLKDDKGNVTSTRGIIQKEDGSFVCAKDGETLMDADNGYALGGYWDKESSWASLERLSGDATNRDVLSGWDNLGKFAGGNHTEAVAKLEKWGQGYADRGIDALEQNWGNGDGRAAQGMDTYLSMGAGAAMKKAQDKGIEGFGHASAAVASMLFGKPEQSAEALKKSFKSFSEAAVALKSGHSEAERLRELVHKDADVSGDLISARGNNDCHDGVCELKKDGDDGTHVEKPGEPASVERGILENLKWDNGGSFGDALRRRADIAGGDMIKLGTITEKMGTTETLGENGEVVTAVSRMAGNESMLKLGTQPLPNGLVDANGKVVEGVTVGADGKVVGADGKPINGISLSSDGKGLVGPDGKAIAGLTVGTDGKIEGQATRRVDPDQAVTQFKRAGTEIEIKDGVEIKKYDGMVAAENFYNAGVTTAMQLDSTGKLTPVLDAEGKPVYLRSADRAVDAVLTIGGGNPVTGMDAMQELSTKRDAEGKLISVNPTVGFEQLPKIGETLQATEQGTVVPVRDVAVSAQTILNYGAPALDASGKPIPQLDANGKEIPQGVVGAQALVEVTRISAGTDGANIYTSLQAATTNERAMFARGVADGKVEPGATFSAAESTRESLQFIGRTADQTSGSALEGARLLTREQTGADGRTFTVSPDGSVVGALNTIRQADTAPADQKTVMGGAQEIALFSARANGSPEARVERDALGFPKPLTAGSEQTFIAGATQTAAMADRINPATGKPMESTQLFSNGISNVQAYSKDGTSFAGGRETIQVIGGGASNPEAIPQGVREVRTAADTTTGGSVRQMADVTRTAGGGDPIVGAQSLMSYNGREQKAEGSYSKGAEALYKDLYGSPSAPQNAGQTLQPRDVERAVSLANPGTPAVSQLQSGMDKTNEIVRASGNTNLTGSQVLQNIVSNQPAFEAVKNAATPIEARQALQAAGLYERVITVAPTAAVKDQAAITQTAPVQKPEAVLAGNAAEKPVIAPAIQQQTVNGGQSVYVAERSVTLAAAERAAVEKKEKEEELRRVAAVAAAEVKPVEQKPVVVAPTITIARPVEMVARESSSKEMTGIKGEVKPANDNGNVRLVAGNNGNAIGNNGKLEVASLVNLAKTLGGESGLFKSGSQAMTALQSIISSQKTSGIDTRIGGQSIISLASAKSVVTSGFEALQRAAHGNVNINLSASLAKSALSAGFGSHDARTALRQGDISGIKTSSATASHVTRLVGPGDVNSGTSRITSLRAGGSNPTSAAIGRGIDMQIGRTFQGFGGISSAETDLKVARAKMRKIKRLNDQDLALLGAEIALAALLVSASIAKQKAEKQENAKSKKKGNNELAKASDSLEDASEISQDDSTQGDAYQVLTRPTWLVRPGEDLVKLAEHLFHEGELGWLIADLNIGQTKESYIDGKRIVELKTRQKIDLPVWQDIVEFHKRRPENALPENLVTVVSEAAVDTELMNATLGLAMGANQAPVAAKVATKPALVIAGLAPTAKEGDKRPLLASAKRAAMVVRNAAKTATAAVADNNDQGPTAPAVATNEELKPKYV